MGKTLSSLEGNVRAIVSIGFVLGLGLIMLGKFTAIPGITDTANDSVKAVITNLATFSSWVGIIILVAVFGYLMHSFKSK